MTGGAVTFSETDGGVCGGACFDDGRWECHEDYETDETAVAGTVVWFASWGGIGGVGGW